MNVRRIVLLLLPLVLLPACSRDGEAPASNVETAAASPLTNRIDVPPTVRSNLGMTFVKVERRRVDSTTRVPGAFELRPLARHEYRMTLHGSVRLEVDQHQQVAPGDLLYRFLSPEWPELQHEIIVGEQDIEAANAAIAVAAARMQEAERRQSILRDRLDSLAAAGSRSAELEAQASEISASLPRLQAELRQAETSLANAHRTREHALHRASAASGIPEELLAEPIVHDGESMPAYRAIDWIEVRATEPGIVETLALTDGAFAEAPSLVLATVDPTKVRFRASALQADLSRLRNAPAARIAPPSALGASPEEGVDADLTIGLEAHPEQRTITLLATPRDVLPWMRPGVSAFLEVVLTSSEGPTIAVPRAAIVRDGLVHVLFRRDPSDPNKVIRVEADIGVSDGRWVAINSGLMLNDEVVLDGAYELKLASQQSGASQKGGHFHADGSFHGDH